MTAFDAKTEWLFWQELAKALPGTVRDSAELWLVGDVDGIARVVNEQVVHDVHDPAIKDDQSYGWFLRVTMSGAIKWTGITSYSRLAEVLLRVACRPEGCYLGLTAVEFLDGRLRALPEAEADDLFFLWRALAREAEPQEPWEFNSTTPGAIAWKFLVPKEICKLAVEDGSAELIAEQVRATVRRIDEAATSA